MKKATAKNKPAQKSTPHTPFQLVTTGDHTIITAHGIIYDGKISVEDWSRQGVNLATAGVASMWGLGDWLNYGIAHFPAQYEEAVKRTGLAYGTLRNMASVCKRFPLEKRNEALSFEHHRLLAPVKDEATIADIAARVEKDGLSAAAMKELIPKTAKKPPTDAQQIKLADDKDEKMRTAAQNLIEYLGDLPTRFQGAWSKLLDEVAEAVETAAPICAEQLKQDQAEHRRVQADLQKKADDEKKKAHAAPPVATRPAPKK